MFVTPGLVIRWNSLASSGNGIKSREAGGIFSARKWKRSLLGEGETENGENTAPGKERKVGRTGRNFMRENERSVFS